MKENIMEIYAKDEKDLTTLVQEWIDGNIEKITCRCIKIELQCKQN